MVIRPTRSNHLDYFTTDLKSTGQLLICPGFRCIIWLIIMLIDSLSTVVFTHSDSRICRFCFTHIRGLQNTAWLLGWLPALYVWLWTVSTLLKVHVGMLNTMKIYCAGISSVSPLSEPFVFCSSLALRLLLWRRANSWNVSSINLHGV